jgi:hypothetical protein
VETANRHGPSGNSGRCAKFGLAMGLYSTIGSKDLNGIRLITRWFTEGYGTCLLALYLNQRKYEKWLS